VQLARLGGRRQHQFSLTGDTVNIASRLLETAKSHYASLAVSGAVADAVLEQGAAGLLQGMRRVPDHPIRGRRGHVDVWLGGADVTV
jgi:adenylate cyclase